MLLGNVARSYLRSRAARDSYIEISNYIRHAQIPSPIRSRCGVIGARPFSIRNRLREEDHSQLAPKYGFLDQYKKTGMELFRSPEAFD